MNEKRAHAGVRDFLVHKLYEMSDTDIDFVLPQLWYVVVVDVVVFSIFRMSFLSFLHLLISA